MARPHGTTKEDSKRHWLRVRCHERDLERWRRKAWRANKTLSEWVRERLDR